MPETSAPGRPVLLSLSEHLQHVTEALAATSRQEEVFQIILDPALAALDAIAGAVLRVDETRTHLKVVATAGHKERAQTIWQDGPLDDQVPAGDALRRQQALHFEHQGALVAAYPELEARTGAIAPVASAVLPMFLDGQPLGVIVIDFKEPHDFTAEEKRFLHTLASQCAVALGRVQPLDQQTLTLERKASQNERALEAFVRFTTAVSTSTDLEVLATAAADIIRDVVGDATSGFYLFNGDTASPLVFSSNTPPEVMDARRSVGVSIRTALVAEALNRRGVAFAEHDQGRQQSVGYASALSITPYWLHDRPYALFATGTERTSWTEQEKAITESVGQGLGLALERVHQAQQLQEERAGLDAFVAFTEGSGDTTDLLELARRAIDVLRTTLGDVSVAYYDLHGDLWKAQVWSEDFAPDVAAVLAAGIPVTAPSYAEALRTRQVVFVPGWEAEAEGVARTESFGAGAFYPCFVDGQPQGLLAMGTRRAGDWTARERAVFGAVGRSLTLALERNQGVQQLQAQKEEAERRRQALEAFAVLSRDLAGETSRYALVRRAQEIILSLLTPGYALYWEEADDHWALKSQVGDIGNPELQRLVDEEGLPLDAPALHSAWLTGEPNYQDNDDQGADTPAEMIRHVYAAAAFRVHLHGTPTGMLAIGLFDQRVWTPMDRAALETAIYSLELVLERAQSVEALAERTVQLEATNGELQAANEELEAFTYSASHDLRTPVRHVMGFAELAQKALLDTPNRKAQQHLEVIKQGALRMTSLIDGMLVLSRSGRQELKTQGVDLNEVVSQARRDVEAEFVGRPVRWQVAHLPLVRGDREMLQQVMTNLLSNAVKYSARREVSEVRVWSEEKASEWCIHVQDNGVGFDPKYAQKLFGIFQRLHTEREFQGTGVGLATVKRIVLKHGGRVFAESRSGSGAMFSFTLPRGR